MIDCNAVMHSTYPGVYRITNTAKGKSYIGSAKNIRKRILEHCSRLTAQNHQNKELQKDFNAGDDFTVSVLERVDVSFSKEIKLHELQWIEGAKRKGERLYNKGAVTTPYATKDDIIKKFAEMYCHEHFGKSVAQYLTGYTPAKIDMLYQILCDPGNEEKIRNEYSEIIKYQQKQLYDICHKRR